MLHRLAFIVLAMLAAPLPGASAASYAEAAQMLDGQWTGDSFVLRVDAKRAQASVALGRPFEWERFLIKEVREGEVVFTIGAELFEARIGADMLTLTGTSFRGARVLFREIELRGTNPQ